MGLMLLQPLITRLNHLYSSLHFILKKYKTCILNNCSFTATNSCSTLVESDEAKNKISSEAAD